jgi:hypothetical protein
MASVLFPLHTKCCIHVAVINNMRLESYVSGRYPVDDTHTNFEIRQLLFVMLTSAVKSGDTNIDGSDTNIHTYDNRLPKTERSSSFMYLSFPFFI